MLSNKKQNKGNFLLNFNLKFLFFALSTPNSPLTGNSLVILSVLFSRKLHTISNAFVVNLSIADLITCINLSGVVTQFYTPFGVQIGPEWWCVLIPAVNLTCIGVSILTLASISTIRALVVTRPFVASRLPK